MTRGKATIIGFSAVALWALLAVFTVASAPVPPFQLSAMTFAIGGAVGDALHDRSEDLGLQFCQGLINLT